MYGYFICCYTLGAVDVCKKKKKIKTPLIADISRGESGEERRVLALYVRTYEGGEDVWGEKKQRKE